MVRLLEKARDWSFLQGVQTGSKVHRTFCLMGTGDWGGGGRGKAWSASYAAVKNMWIYTFTQPYAFMACTRTILSLLNWCMRYKIRMGDPPEGSASNRRDVLMTSGEGNVAHKLFLTCRWIYNACLHSAWERGRQTTRSPWSDILYRGLDCSVALISGPLGEQQWNSVSICCGKARAVIALFLCAASTPAVALIQHTVQWLFGIFHWWYCGRSVKLNTHFHLALCLTLRRLMSYIYGAPILDVSRSHTTTQHSR